MKTLIALTLVALFPLSLFSEIITKEIDYKMDDTNFKGYLAYNENLSGKQPGVLVVHEWWGLNEFTKSKTRALADLGYTALAIDMYGDGKSTKDPAVAGRLAGAVRGTPLMRQRARAGLQALLRQERVDTQRVAAIGFCFGGTAVLTLAYGGAPIKGVVSFHGGILTPALTEIPDIRTSFLVLHGADDPNVPRDSITAFQASMRRLGTDWQMIYYGNAVHAFTNPDAGSDNSKGAAYNKQAADRSWRAMRDFLIEKIGK